MKNVHKVVSIMTTKELTSYRDAIHYHSLKCIGQFTSEAIDAGKCLVNLSIALYTLFIELDKFINKSSTLIHAKDIVYKSREKYLLSFDGGKPIRKY